MVKKYTILIVDDKVENLKYLNTILKKENYEIKATTNASFAIDSAINNPVDLILLDIKMPELNGFEVCKNVKENPKTSHVRIITMSGMVNEETSKKLIELGAEECFQKPLNINKLLTILNINIPL